MDDDPSYPSNINESTGDLVKVLSDIEEGKSGAQQASSVKFRYTDKDVIMYALSVGVTIEDAEHLRFLYEGSEDFAVLPTFAVIPTFPALEGIFTKGVPGLSNIDPTRALHGEQYFEVYKPFAKEATLTSETKVAAVLDKGSGAVVIVDVRTRDEDGEEVCYNQFSIFFVGAGNFGGPRSSAAGKPPLPAPARAPDVSVKQRVGTSQAALYRLNGDRNPLHIDPSFAAIGGFKQPILHGLCSFGYAGRHVLASYGGMDPGRCRAMKARFASPVLPGQTLQTDMWRQGTRIFFTTKVVETGKAALTGGYMDLSDVVESGQASKAQPQAGGDTVGSGGAGLQSAAKFDALARRLEAKPELAKSVGAVFQWNITKGGAVAGQYCIDLKSPPGAIYSGPAKGKPDCTITVDDDNLVKLLTGKANPQQLFMQGKLKVSGNVMLTMKLQKLLKDEAKL